MLSFKAYYQTVKRNLNSLKLNLTLLKSFQQKKNKTIIRWNSFGEQTQLISNLLFYWISPNQKRQRRWNNKRPLHAHYKVS